ncbi:unnamed protein product, partial [marine sediment metagenome]
LDHHHGRLIGVVWLPAGHLQVVGDPMVDEFDDAEFPARLWTTQRFVAGSLFW